MQKLMDNYIAAEDVIRITNPVNIHDRKALKKNFKAWLQGAKADAIRTRMTKSISEKWNENPAYYKKFSKRIEETLNAYKDKRISEREYLERMMEVMDDYRKGESGIEYPTTIEKNLDAQAFYGVTEDVFKRKLYDG